MSGVTYGEGRLRDSAGRDVFYRHWSPPGNPRAVVVLVHGLAEHSGRYVALATQFAEAGFATWALDLPGHGKSEGTRCHADRFTDYTQAVDALISELRRSSPAAPLFLLGHSMGGLIAGHLLMQDASRFFAAGLSGPAVRAPQPPSALLLAIVRAIARFLPRLGALKLDASGVSRDPAVVKAYVEDPLVHTGKVSARLVTELFRAMDELRAGAAVIRLPLLIQHGSADTLTAVDGSRELFAGVSSAQKLLKVYDGLYHEIFNEPEGRSVAADTIHWIEQHLPAAAAAGGRE